MVFDERMFDLEMHVSYLDIARVNLFSLLYNFFFWFCVHVFVPFLVICTRRLVLFSSGLPASVPISLLMLLLLPQPPPPFSSSKNHHIVVPFQYHISNDYLRLFISCHFHTSNIVHSSKFFISSLSHIILSSIRFQIIDIICIYVSFL